MIFLHEPQLGSREKRALAECIDTGWISTAGPFVSRFESGITEITGSRHAVAVASGTAALHMALLLAGIRPDDEVIVPTLTFIAPVNAIRYCGAHPVFMDCDEFLNLDPAKLLEFLVRETRGRRGECFNRRTGRRIRALLPVHVLGNPVDLAPVLAELAERRILLVEDAAEALGSRYVSGPLRGRHAGVVGLAGCLSFNANKIATCGGGGAVITNDRRIAERARYLVSQAKNDPRFYVHDEVGYNYGMTNLQAAVGYVQLSRVQERVKRKEGNFRAMARIVELSKSIRMIESPSYARANRWLTAARLSPSSRWPSIRDTVRALEQRGIQARPLWRLNHRQKPYLRCQAYRIDQAERAAREVVLLPSGPTLSKTQATTVMRTLISLRRSR